MENSDVMIREAGAEDLVFAGSIALEMNASARARGTGISKRSAGSIKEKIMTGKAVIAVTKDGQWAGFIYMESWAGAQFVSHHGLIVPPEWRRKGIATRMKEQLFALTRRRYPQAKIFGITSTLATMKINSGLGLMPVTYSEIVQEAAFWNKCKSCVHYNDLEGAGFKNCFCTAMLFDPVAREAVAAMPHAGDPGPAVC